MQNTPKLTSALRCPVCREKPTLSGKYFHKEDCPYYQTSPQVKESPMTPTTPKGKKNDTS